MSLRSNSSANYISPLFHYFLCCRYLPYTQRALSYCSLLISGFMLFLLLIFYCFHGAKIHILFWILQKNGSNCPLQRTDFHQVSKCLYLSTILFVLIVLISRCKDTYFFFNILYLSFFLCLEPDRFPESNLGVAQLVESIINGKHCRDCLPHGDERPRYHHTHLHSTGTMQNRGEHNGSMLGTCGHTRARDP